MCVCPCMQANARIVYMLTRAVRDRFVARYCRTCARVLCMLFERRMLTSNDCIASALRLWMHAHARTLAFHNGDVSGRYPLHVRQRKVSASCAPRTLASRNDTGSGVDPLRARQAKRPRPTRGRDRDRQRNGSVWAVSQRRRATTCAKGHAP